MICHSLILTPAEIELREATLAKLEEAFQKIVDVQSTSDQYLGGSNSLPEVEDQLNGVQQLKDTLVECETSARVASNHFLIRVGISNQV
jgi:hypothetical protein